MRYIALLISLIAASILGAQAPGALGALTKVRVVVVIASRGTVTAPVDTAAIASALRSSLRAHGWTLADLSRDPSVPLVFFGALVSGAELAGPTSIFAISYEYTLNEEVGLLPPQKGRASAAIWSAGGAVDITTSQGAVSGAIQRMAAALTQKLNHARGPIPRP